MIKAIAVFDVLKPSKSVLEYAAYLQKNFDAFIVAAFLEEVAYRSEPVGVDPLFPYRSSDLEKIEQVNRKDEQIKVKALEEVADYFKSNDVRFSVHKDTLSAYVSLLAESRFADLILIDESTSFSNYNKEFPSEFIHELLVNSKCSVLLVPPTFYPFESVIIAYDESPSALYACKEFMHLFPVLDHQPVEIITIVQKPKSSNLPDRESFQELWKIRYPHGEHKIISSCLDAKLKLVQYIRRQKQKCLVVLGAYDRSYLSMLIEESTADKLIRKLEMPVFVAHP